MKGLLIFGGTTEGRRLAEIVSRRKIPCTVCVATQYGEMVMDEDLGDYLRVCKGRMNKEQIRDFAAKGDFFAVVDATHPFAVEVSANIREGLKESSLPCIRLVRDTGVSEQDSLGRAEPPEPIRWFVRLEDCKDALIRTTGNILLTTGSKELGLFDTPELKSRLFVRVLPAGESLRSCEDHGITGKQIIAMQGPFSVRMNEAILSQFQIAHLVTKESGTAGGFQEKLTAARNLGIPVYAIGNPDKNQEGLGFEETVQTIFSMLGLEAKQAEMKLSLIGMGMGTRETLTLKAKAALDQAQIVFGASRLLEQIPDGKRKFPFYLARDILPRLREMDKEYRGRYAAPAIAVLFSGDTGFYSGGEKLYGELKEFRDFPLDIEVIPGITCVSYLGAKAGISWNGAAIASTHGRDANICDLVRRNRKTFVLVSGAGDMRALGTALGEAGLEGVTGVVGYQLSAPEEEIMYLSPMECRKLYREGLYCCLILNGEKELGALTHGIGDECFLRGNVPMTKEEIREISVCKLKLTRGAVLYDIGSGTGSVSVECARIAEDITVYAIEKNLEGIGLIRQNAERFHISNVKIVHGEAPGALEGLPVPTHVFIGGSGGNLKEIISSVLSKNPRVRIVINAITLETVSAVTVLLKELSLQEEDAVQVQVSRSKKVGSYHLIQAENPVFIFTIHSK